MTRPVPVRDMPPRLEAVDTTRAPEGLAAGGAGALVVDIEGCLLAREAGRAGGPMEDLDATLTEGRAGRPPVEAVRALEGVPVREVVALEVAVEPSCLVGDLVGDWGLHGSAS